MTLPDYRDVLAARKRLAGHALHTPLLNNAVLDIKVGARVFLKAECLQRTGSFKFRGAYNAISRLGDEAMRHGVIACSSGNHAQGLAEAGRLLGVEVTIVMPADAPEIKRARTERSGAIIVPYDRETGDRDEITGELAARTGAILVHPFNNAQVIAGQGTAGLEIAEDLKAQDIVPDAVVVPTGGGGLLAGTVLAIHENFPNAEIYAVEPEGFDDYRRSLKSGELCRNQKSGGSLCDALLSPMAGEIGFSISGSKVTGGLVVSDDEALHAVALAFFELKCVVEPGGAVALAAVIANKDKFAGKTVAMILSGGNIDPTILQKALAGYESN